jgi:hypothetical protein
MLYVLCLIFLSAFVRTQGVALSTCSLPGKPAPQRLGQRNNEFLLVCLLRTYYLVKNILSCKYCARLYSYVLCVMMSGPQEIEIGLGIHGEAGKEKTNIKPINELVIDNYISI